MSAIAEDGGVPRKGPRGGYEPVSVEQLAMIWWAYRKGHITKLALRAYFGCVELEVRRRLSAGKYQPSLEGLGALVGAPLGGGQGGLRLAVGRLLELGLVRSWSKGGVSFAESGDELHVEERSTLADMLSQLRGLSRKVPVPRRMLRRLAGGLSQARTAVVIAHLIRCLFYRKGTGVNPVGCCKASWIAEVFGVTERSVFDARRFLIDELGWLLPRDCTQRVLNRDGLWVSVNLDWGPGGRGPAAEPVAAEISPPGIESSGPRPGNEGLFSGPSTQDKNPLTGSKNQEPTSRPGASGGPAGVKASGSGEEPPTLRDIRPEDLRETPRLLSLHGQAVRQAIISGSEADRLKFLAGADHARAVGSDPCRLFAWMLRGKRWDYITQADEDAARSRLRGVRGTLRSPEPARPKAGQAPPLSEDALLVRTLRAALGRAGHRGDPFPQLRRQKPDWTRERWERAVAELDRPRSGGEAMGGLDALGALLKGLNLTPGVGS